MDYKRLYEFRFRDHDRRGRAAAWTVITEDLFVQTGKPQVVLDPASGRGDFFGAVPAAERWAIHQVPSVTDLENRSIHTIASDTFEVEVPYQHFDAILLSNTLEHCAKEYFDCSDHVLALIDVSMQEHLYAAGVRHLLGVTPLPPLLALGPTPAIDIPDAPVLRSPWVFRLLGTQFLVIAAP